MESVFAAAVTGVLILVGVLVANIDMIVGAAVLASMPSHIARFSSML